MKEKFNQLDFDIIMLALPRWDGEYASTAYSLAQELSRHTRVFYIDNPFTFKDYISRRKSLQIKKRRKALLGSQDRFSIPNPEFPQLIAVTPALTFPINWLPRGAAYTLGSKINDRIVFKAISDLIKVYRVNNFIFVNSFNPLFGSFFPAKFNPLLSVYHCVDDISKSVYVAKHGTRLEKEMVGKADLTIVTSIELKNLKSKQAKTVHYLPNAANVDLFRTALNDLPRPAELKDIPVDAKIVLYMGNICHRLDYDLLIQISTDFPDHYLVMVGPKSYDIYLKKGLDKLPNVVFTGSKKIEELPAFVRHSACCIIPFLCIPLTKSIYPLKINEYLSAGKPVVTTKFSEDILTFADVALVSATHAAFLNHIRIAIASDSEAKCEARVKYAAANNWESRAVQFVEIITNHLKTDVS